MTPAQTEMVLHQIAVSLEALPALPGADVAKRILRGVLDVLQNHQDRIAELESRDG